MSDAECGSEEYNTNLAFEVVRTTLAEAVEEHGPFRSRHEAYGVLAEEFEEFKSAIFWGIDQHGEPSHPVDEAIQIAAVAIRFIVEEMGLPDNVVRLVPEEKE